MREGAGQNREPTYEEPEENAVRKRVVSEKTGVVQYDEFWPSKSKHIIDEIDRVLARHYGFTEEDLDFITNYDNKYRMGRDADREEEHR